MVYSTIRRAFVAKSGFLGLLDRVGVVRLWDR
jgi:hypothetical protein